MTKSVTSAGQFLSRIPASSNIGAVQVGPRLAGIYYHKRGGLAAEQNKMR